MLPRSPHRSDCRRFSPLCVRGLPRQGAAAGLFRIALFLPSSQVSSGVGVPRLYQAYTQTFSAEVPSAFYVKTTTTRKSDELCRRGPELECVMRRLLYV